MSAFWPRHISDPVINPEPLKNNRIILREETHTHTVKMTGQAISFTINMMRRKKNRGTTTESTQNSYSDV